ncbi:MAG: aminoglycoside phosphotransferase family protein [Burkholderiaceae bacterium]
MNTANPLPVDPLLPHLSLAVDGTAMVSVFDRLLRAQQPKLSVLACAVDRIKYRPRRNIAVSYRLRVRDAHSGRTFIQLVATRFCSEGESRQRHANGLRRAAVGNAVGLASSHVAALDMVAAWWPNDAKLGEAAALLSGDQHTPQGVLNEVIAALTEGRGELISHAFHLAQVVPEHRACARVELAYRAATSGPVLKRTVYVKAEAERAGADTHAVMQALKGSPAQSQGRLLTPRPILWQTQRGLHWQEALPGMPLLDEANEVSVAAAQRVGSMLAGLHATPVPTQRCVGVDELRERLALVADTLAIVEPRWEGAVRSLSGALTQGVGAACEAKSVTLHGDLHPRNILVADDRIGLIDLDGLRLGPAVADLGDWIADSLYRALLAGRSAAMALATCRAFVNAYAGASGTACGEAELAWSTANSLFCQRAWRSVVNLKPGRYALVEPLLDTAAAILRSGSIDAALDVPQRLAA